MQYHFISCICSMSSPSISLVACPSRFPGPAQPVKLQPDIIQHRVQEKEGLQESQSDSNPVPIYSLDSEMSDISREKKRMRDDIEEYSRAAKRSRWDISTSDEDD